MANNNNDGTIRDNEIKIKISGWDNQGCCQGPANIYYNFTIRTANLSELEIGPYRANQLGECVHNRSLWEFYYGIQYTQHPQGQQKGGR